MKIVVDSPEWHRQVDYIAKKKGTYKNTFNSEFGSQVLADLRSVTCADSTTYDPDPVRSAVNVGMREVWLYIDRYLNKPSDQLVRELLAFNGHEVIEKDEAQ